MAVCLQFDQADLLRALDRLSDAQLDLQPFGVIGFAAQPDAVVQRYNAFESRMSRLLPAEVLGRALFTEVAPCMNNHLVAQRFEDAVLAQQPLDLTLDYVLSWRMRPTPVHLRLLSDPATAQRYVLLRRV